MPSDKFKFSAKSGVVAPVIKKLCNGKKKLLGKTSTPVKNGQKAKEVEKPQQIQKTPSKIVENANIIDETHAYENVCFSYNSSDEKSESFSEEVFAGVNLSLSSLNLDNESIGLDSTSETSCHFISSDCSTLTNYAETDTSANSADIDSSQNRSSEVEASDSQNKNGHPTEKLKSAIDNFDKILNEYTAPLQQHQPKPKLQKSKTCSIIESKCILKKSLSASTTADTSFKSLDLAQMSTKSLCHLDKDGGGTFSEFVVKDLAETQRFLSETNFWKVSGNKKVDLGKEMKQEEENTIEAKAVKVKEVVKRLNSLSEDEGNKVSVLKKAPTKQNVKPTINGKSQKKMEPKEKLQQKSLTSKPPLQKSLSSETKSILKSTKTKQMDTKREPSKDTTTPANVRSAKPLQSKLSQIPRAISCYDISSKKVLTSKIPIKTNLNRTFPSTPGNLNNIDSSVRCTPLKYEVKCQSVQNLAAKIGQNEKKSALGQRRLVNVDLERTVSCQNLSRSSANISEGIKNERMSLARKNSGEPTRDSSKVVKGEEVLKAKVIVQDGKKIVSSNNGGVQKDWAGLKTVENHNEVRKSANGATKLMKSWEIEENRKKLGRKMTSNKIPPNLTPFSSAGKCSKQELVTDEEKEVVKRFLEDFKNEEQLNSKIYVDPNTSTEVKKTDTFGVRKSSVEAKFFEAESPKKNSVYNGVSTIKKNVLKRTDTYSKNQRIKEFQAIEKIEQNLKIAKEFLVNTKFVSCEIFDSSIYSKANCVLNVEDSFQLKNISTPDIRKDEEILRNIPKITINDICLNKTKDYLSDENSDDSGNISNELELEYEDLPTSKRSILDKVNKDDEFFSSKRENKIFFRSGVLTQLESQRDEKLAGMVVSLQAHCRGYLARKRLSQRKLQDLAVRCIQRNVRKFLLVRDWPWWRLLVRVTPLLNVHRTEEELRLKTEELELLKAKLEKLETERTSLKHQNDKLEAKLSEMTADLAEEHSTSTLAAERLDAETADRIRLERELGEVQQKNKDLQNASERLEMELLYARSELNGISEDDEDADGEAVYKQRYERAMRELEFTKRRLQQQHEDDLEQLVGLKKQLEKKLTDAYEEVEEQRQVVGQWKRKVQKLNGEMNDLKLLLEEQSGRNNLLEKKQRKFDSELQLLHDELKKEKQAKDRLSREKEVLTAEKFTLESNAADLRLELDLKEEKLNSLNKDLDELTYGGKTEEEVTLLRKQKIDCERRLHDQEEELDELAGQVQLLEQAKLKLEMNLEQQRKCGKKEAQQHEEELEEVRCNAQKKVKALEAQLENEHEERTILLREKHELERRLTTALENDRSEKACDEAVLQRLKRDLKRTKALLRDTQAQLERQKAENPSKALIRQLKNQIEDLECARSAAVKTKQILEADLSETQAQLEETVRQKNESEERANTINREKADLQLQVEENEEELAEVLKKYKITIQQMSLDQLALQEQVSLVGELEAERNSLKEQLVELTSKLDSLENAGDASSNVLVKRTELKVKELESKLDLEQTTRGRLEVQISRLKETMEKLQNDLVNSRTKEQAAQDQIRKLQRSLRELRDEHNNTLTKESESLLKRKELEKRYEALEAESSTVRTDLRLALKRIEDLQAVIQNDLEDSTENSDSEHDSYSSDDSVNTFLANHKISNKSNSMQFDSQRKLTNASRSSTSNNIAKDSSSYA